MDCRILLRFGTLVPCGSRRPPNGRNPHESLLKSETADGPQIFKSL